ncbi:Translation initiation factor eIF3, p35 subunit [Scheffersomyces stipitis CBS 6054]|uniref:Eukaryotic translation initiation factor 3 subunit J n=1 Tax=Scheffersomyces stipitis (strain ATCC 58785 / CBS 6054 / NBRC 10063 / NRRL Y-11545) TaxID=322104 RepID=A3GI93_PICST|nr:Translation initiation factor eIF3, p35 subunit [Scheffersomyces stipitis CBS 6054]EAZ62947.1 Translation initiation factor eIF3, p35 subunit [Scheffersomyces stipitis CBS 6054]
MSWDDEDFDIPSKAPANVASASWEDEEDDDPILESWDIDEEEAELKKKQEEAKLKKLNAKKGIRGVLDVDELDDDVRKELMKEEALRADLNNTADLFGGLGVSADDALEHPKERLNRAILAAQSKKPVLTKDTPLEEHPLFQPTNKQEYENLRKGVGSALTKLADDSIMNYSSSLAIDLIRDLSVPLSVENLRKVISTLNVAIKDKEKAERLARLKKSGGTATGGAGKKKAKPAARPNVGGGFMKDGLDEMDNYDDFGDDDFM